MLTEKFLADQPAGLKETEVVQAMEAAMFGQAAGLEEFLKRAPLILSLPAADQVHILGTFAFYQALQKDLTAFAVAVSPMDLRLGLKVLLVAAGVPEEVLRQINWTSVESTLTSLEAA